MKNRTSGCVADTVPDTVPAATFPMPLKKRPFAAWAGRTTTSCSTTRTRFRIRKGLAIPDDRPTLWVDLRALTISQPVPLRLGARFDRAVRIRGP